VDRGSLWYRVLSARYGVEEAAVVRVIATTLCGGGLFFCCVRWGGLTTMLATLLAMVLIPSFGLMFGWAVCRYETGLVDYLSCRH
jgi:hypothetical protein